MKIESKIGIIKNSKEKIYNFLINFNNFKHLIPADKVHNWHSTEDSCKFEIEGIGQAGMKIIDKEPFKTIKITGIEESRFNFFFWIQLKQITDNETKVKLTLKPELNPMMQMMAKKPLQNLVDELISQLEKYNF